MSTSHTNCSHPKTKAARAACRKQSQVFEPATTDEEWLENTRTDSEYADRAWDPEDTADYWVIQYRDAKRDFWRTDTATMDRGEAKSALWNFVSRNPGSIVRVIPPASEED